MKPTIFLIIILSITSWRVDTKGPWIRTESDRIILFTRPLNYSESDSPDSLQIQKIVQNQEEAIDHTNNRLNTKFNSKVKIYLFNFDEAKEKIGTNGGGGASLNKFKKHIYFTFHSKPYFNTVMNRSDHLGVHEMVHIITMSELGNIRSRFFGEGYANAIDGNYGVKIIEDQLVRRRNDNTLAKIKAAGKLLSPSDLLYKDNIPENEYYPQIGCLVDWLFKEYGVDKINRLYRYKRDKIEDKFLEVTGESFADMGAKYFESI